MNMWFYRSRERTKLKRYGKDLWCLFSFESPTFFSRARILFTKTYLFTHTHTQHFPTDGYINLGFARKPLSHCWNAPERVSKRLKCTALLSGVLHTQTHTVSLVQMESNKNILYSWQVGRCCRHRRCCKRVYVCACVSECMKER